jgi:TRAP-type transport system periplasmic protein
VNKKNGTHFRRTIQATLAGSVLLTSITVFAQPTTIKLAHVAPPTSSFQVAAARLNDALQKASNNTMQLEIIAGGTLGNIPQLWGQVRAGSLDMHLADMAAITAMKEARSFSITNMPYLFRDEAHYVNFVASPVFTEMMAEVETTANMKFVGFLGQRPPRALSTGKTPVKSLADIKGLKVRTPEIGAITDAFKAFGASPTPIRAAELYTALQTGLVDGQDNGITDTVSAGYTEVQKYFSPIDYLQSGIGVWVSAKRWSSLSPQQQGWLTKAAQEAGLAAKAAYAAENSDAFAKAKTKGMQILDVDKSGFQRVGAELINAKDGVDWPKGLADRIRAVK